ncbi:DUF2892 domain-containing protein [bacterium]|nr:DUF2892 domain-containing protein [bacterium]
MFTANIGSPDRMLRVVVGVALIIWFFMDQQSGGVLHWLKALVGIIALVTAAVNFCPLYRVLGIKTN